MVQTLDAVLAQVTFCESMGYSVARLLPGASSHNNAWNPILDVPGPLLDKWFTQVVASRVSPIEVEFLTRGKLFVLVGTNWSDSQSLLDHLGSIGFKEPLPHLVTEGVNFEVYSISGVPGDRLVLPTQAMLVADGLSRAQVDHGVSDAGIFNARVLVIAARCGSGAFSMFFHTLGLLGFAEAAGLIPIVYFNRQVCYWSDLGHLGSRNAWEYFFQPVSHLTMNSLGRDSRDLENLDTHGLRTALGDRVIVRDDYLGTDVGYAGWIDERQRGISARLVERYVRIHPELVNRIDDFCNEHFQGHYVVGVHHRGTDKVIEATPPAFERYELELQQRLSVVPDLRIFVATDCAHFLHRIRDAFGNRVLCTNACRSHDGRPIHWGNPQSGAEVVIDAVLLSRTSHLLHGISNVSAAALVFNRDLPHTNLA